MFQKSNTIFLIFLLTISFNCLNLLKVRKFQIQEKEKDINSFPLVDEKNNGTQTTNVRDDIINNNIPVVPSGTLTRVETKQNENISKSNELQSQSAVSQTDEQLSDDLESKETNSDPENSHLKESYSEKIHLSEPHLEAEQHSEGAHPSEQHLEPVQDSGNANSPKPYLEEQNSEEIHPNESHLEAEQHSEGAHSSEQHLEPVQDSGNANSPKPYLEEQNSEEIHPSPNKSHIEAELHLEGAHPSEQHLEPEEHSEGSQPVKTDLGNSRTADFHSNDLNAESRQAALTNESQKDVLDNKLLNLLPGSDELRLSLPKKNLKRESRDISGSKIQNQINKHNLRHQKNLNPPASKENQSINVETFSEENIKRINEFIRLAKTIESLLNSKRKEKLGNNLRGGLSS